MKKTIRIIVALLLTMIMIISMSTTAFADTIVLSGNCGPNGGSNAKFKLVKIDNYELVNNCYDRERIVISGSGEMEDYALYTSGYTTSPWTYSSRNINSIIVEEGITRIGNNAFVGDYAGSVCRISLPSTLESIGEFAFAQSLNHVKELTIPSSVKLLGECAFSGIGVETVTIPGSISYIPEQAFSSCDNLKSVVMLEGVTRIGPDAFLWNEKLESVTIPASVTQIDQCAFSICEKLKTIHYKGTPEQWEEITIAAGNDYLLNATVNFPKIAVESVSLDKATKTLFVGSTFTLTATVMPENAYDKRVNWKSSNTSVATVSDGVVTAKAAGTAKITATTVDGAKVASCTVSVQQAPNVAVTGVSLNKSSADLSVGETETLTATITPSNATNQNVTWSSSNTIVASVSSNGVVTAKASGTAKITVKTTDGNWTASCDITVRNSVITVTGISLNRTSVNLVIGQTETLAAIITPTNATDKNVTWSSSNTDIATVSSSGVVTAKAVGTVTITATTVDGNKTATCTVVVEKQQSSGDDEICGLIKVNDAKSCAGKTVDVVISIENNPGIAILGFNVNYDKTAMTLKSATLGEIFTGELECNINAVPFVFNVYSGSSNKTNNGKLVTLQFEIKSDCVEGDYTISLTNIESLNIAEEDVFFDSINGKVTVSTSIPGDVTGDGNVTRADLLRLAKSFSGFDVDMDMVAADVTGDGNVTRADLLRLAKYFSGFNVALGE